MGCPTVEEFFTIYFLLHDVEAKRTCYGADAVCEIADPLVNGIAQSHTPRGDSLAVEVSGFTLSTSLMA